MDSQRFKQFHLTGKALADEPIQQPLAVEVSMIDASNTHKLLPKPGLLRWEIAIALLLKIILLTGLWFLIFRWPDKPVAKPDIAAHFALPGEQNSSNPDFSSQPPKESSHVR